jgi:hypothetical protein
MKSEKSPQRTADEKRNADPVSGESGSHPVGTVVGAAAGGAALAAVGSLTGPFGTVVGAVVGAVVGGLTGKGFAEGLDPTVEEAHWRERHAEQPYASAAYEVYAVAYRVGYEGYREGQSFADREADLQREYESAPAPGTMEYNLSTKPLHENQPAELPTGRVPGSMEDNLSTKPLAWSQARLAARAAYERIAARAAAEAQRAAEQVK